MPIGCTQNAKYRWKNGEKFISTCFERFNLFIVDVLLQTGRSRKCSIVQEEDDDEDDADRDDLSSPLNRRGSRSEGRINITVQDRLAENERLKKENATMAATAVNLASSSIAATMSGTASTAPMQQRSVLDGIAGVTMLTSSDCDPSLKLGKRKPPIQMRPMINDFRPKTADSIFSSPSQSMVSASIEQIDDSNDAFERISTTDDQSTLISTKFLTDSSTISIPIASSSSSIISPNKFKTMPSPTRVNTILPGTNCLNEIHEEGTDIGSSDTSATTTPRPSVRHTFTTQQRSTSQTTQSTQRRSKFHKSRTASCSSSDDDDSESRKKRAHKIEDSTKQFHSQRRDSHDDSSDSQDPSNATGGGGSNATASGSQCVENLIENASLDEPQQNTANPNGNDTNSTGRQKTNCQAIGFRRTRAGRRRAGETRLRESQSLNRITEVQESELPLTAIINCGTNTTMTKSSMTSQSSRTNSTTSSSQRDDETSDKQQAFGFSERNAVSCDTLDGVEPTAHATNSTATVTHTKGSKFGFGARFFHGFRKSENTIAPTNANQKDSVRSISPKIEHKSGQNIDCNGHRNAAGNDEIGNTLNRELNKVLKGPNDSGKSTSATKKLKMLGRYFQVKKCSNVFYLFS